MMAILNSPKDFDNRGSTKDLHHQRNLQSLDSCHCQLNILGKCAKCTLPCHISSLNSQCVKPKMKSTDMSLETGISTSCQPLNENGMAGLGISCNNSMPKFCIQTESDQKCLVCSSGYYPSAGNCLPNSLGNCREYLLNTNFCQTCQSGYFRTDGFTCAKQEISKCIEYIQNLNTCTLCEVNYSLANNVCIRNLFFTHFCLQYDSKKQLCVLCEEGFYLSQRSCFAQGIRHCANHERNKNVCLECKSPYTLFFNQCVVAAPFCVKYTEDGLVCVQCANNYYFDPNNVCVSVSTQPCQTSQKNIDFCNSCVLPHRLFPEICLPSNKYVNNCVLYDADYNNCLQCDEWLYLKNGGCSGTTVQNCTSYWQNQNVCQNCHSAYFLNNNKCILNANFDDNCLIFNTNGVGCSICVNNFYLQSGVCVQMGTLDCKFGFTNNDLCQICDTGFSLVDNQCIQNVIANCISYAADRSTCVYCDYGYYLDGGACAAQSVANCQHYLFNSNLCQSCPSNMLLHLNFCVTQNLDANCIQYDTANQVCRFCNTLYYLSVNSCVLGTVANCLYYFRTENKCQKCKTGYTLILDKCVSSGLAVSQCIQYSDSFNACQKCREGFYLSGGACVSVPTNENCSEYYFNTRVCRTCQATFTLFENRCIPAADFDANCVKYINYICKLCSPGFYLDVNNKCIASTVTNCNSWVFNYDICLGCSAGSLFNNYCTSHFDGNCISYDTGTGFCNYCGFLFWWDSANNVCKSGVVSNCILYHHKTGFCQKCSTGYTLFDNYCLPNASVVSNCIRYTLETCTLCLQGLYLSGGTCTAGSINDCQHFHFNSNNCTVCSTGSLWNNVCTANALISNCIDYDLPVSSCAHCKPSFYLNSNACDPVSTNTNCQTNIFNTNLCQVCSNTHFLWNSLCLDQANQDANCVIYDSTTLKCKTCNRGFVLNAGFTCDPAAVANCSLFLHNLNSCVSCQTSHTLYNNFCAQHTDANCLSYDTSTGYCHHCSHLYYWNDGTKMCVLGTITNCQMYLRIENTCQKCNTGFTLFDNTCIPNASVKDKCVLYNTSFQCLLCQNGYHLTASGASCTSIPASTTCSQYEIDSTTCVSCLANHNFWNTFCSTNPLIANCIDYTTDLSTCKSCLPTFYLNSNACPDVTATDSNCLTFIFNTDVCLTCKPTFTKWNNKCISATDWDDNCIQYDMTTLKCIFCNRGFNLVADKCTANTVSNCGLYLHNLNHCLSCTTTAFALFNNICASNPDNNCISYASGVSFCHHCHLSYYWDSTNSVCVSGTATVPNCIQFVNDAVAVCQKCSSASTLFANKCISTSSVVANCIEYDSLSACVACKDGHYLSGSSCVAGALPNCLIYSYGQNSCSVCDTATDPNMKVTTGVCESESPIANCIKQSSGVCTHCNTGFHLASGACVASNVSNCSEHYFNINVCKTCNSGFTLWNSVCIPDAKASNCIQNDISTLDCTLCANDYYLNAGICLQSVMSARCSAWVYNKDVCKTCKTGFYLTKNGFCESDSNANCALMNESLNCVFCEPGFFLSGTTCAAQTVANCEVGMFDESYCMKCSSGFLLHNGKCIPTANQVSNADVYDPSNFNLISCESGFHPSGGSCVANSVSCATFVYNSNSCATCSGFLYSGKCVTTDVASCEVYDDVTGNCKYCLSGHYLSAANTCSPQTGKQSSCATYAYNSRSCLTCTSGLRIGDSCYDSFTTTTNCLYYSSTDGKCAVCKVGFYLTQSASCQTQNVPNCATHLRNFNICSECQTSFTLVDYACRASSSTDKSLNCLHFDPESNTCRMCSSGFYLDSSGVCQSGAIANCGVYRSQTYCVSCSSGTLRNGNCITTLISNCGTYDASGDCSACVDGFSGASCDVTATATQTMPNNCAVVDVNGVCVSCNAGYYIDGTVTECTAISNCESNLHSGNFCQTCSTGFIRNFLDCDQAATSSVSNCSFQDSATTCKYCSQGFILSSDRSTCTPVTALTIACTTYFTNSNACKSCSSGTEATGSCVSSTVANCAFYDTTGNCVLCDNLFYLNGGVCTSVTDTNSSENEPNSDLSTACATGTLVDYVCVTSAQTDCQHYKDPSTCDVCKSGFYLNAVNACVAQTVSSCSSFHPNTNNCKACAAGFTLFNHLCIADANVVANCQWYDSSFTACLICKSGYYSSGSSCVQGVTTDCTHYWMTKGYCRTCSTGSGYKNSCIPTANFDSNCIKFDESTRSCVVCAAGFYLTGSSCTSQTGTVTNCMAYWFNSNQCGQCVAGFELANNSCIDQASTEFQANCLFYDSSTNKCKFCNNVSFLDTDVMSCTTSAGVASCAEYLHNLNVCKTCSGNQTPFNNFCPSHVDPNCSEYDQTTGFCKYCKLLYWWNSVTNACVSGTVGNCVLYHSDSPHCQTCDTGFTLFDNKCIPNANYDSNCVRYTSSVCVKCKATYYASAGACVQTNPVTNCLYYSSSSNQCVICSSGFLHNNLCLTQVANCVKYNSDGTACLACDLTYHLSGGACLAGSIANCQTYLFNLNVCKTCSSGNFLWKQVCIPVASFVTGCIEYTGNVCTVCGKGFHLSVINTCSTSSIAKCLSYLHNKQTCTECDVGYYLWSNSCIANFDSNCLEYNQITGFCKYCSPLYYLNAAKACVVGTDSNCLVYVFDKNYCQTCQSTHTLFNGVCILNAHYDGNCRSYHSGSCQYCKQGFYLDGTACVSGSVADCAYYSLTQNRCTECSANSLYANKCGVTLIPNCVEYSADLSSCLSCKAGFFASAGGCSASDVANCAAFYFNVNVCSSCSTGYTLWNLQCIQNSLYSANCILYSAAGVCELCGLAFHLNQSSLCETTTILGCSKYLYHYQVCVECSVGYSLWDNFCTGHPDANCLEYDKPTGYCNFCSLNHFFNPLTRVCELGTVSNCEFYQKNTNVCLGCLSGFTLFDNMCIPNANFDGNCIRFQTDQCTHCKNGFYLTGNTCTQGTFSDCNVYNFQSEYCIICSTHLLYDGRCTSALIADCIYYEDTSFATCKGCTHNFKLQSNTCTAASAVANCLAYFFSTEVCQTCNTGFTLWNNLCIPDSDFSSNCSVFSLTTLKCIFCHPQFTLETTSSTCAPLTAISNCQVYHFDSIYCKSCLTNPSFTLFFNYCIATASVVDNCIEYTDFLCTRCRQSHYLNLNLCIAGTTADCHLFRLNSDVCQLCTPTTFTVFGNTCISAANYNSLCLLFENGVCTYCLPGYFVDGTNACAAGTVLNCLFYKSDQSLCQKCDSNRFLFDNFCYQNSAAISECRQYLSADNSCLHCSQNHYLLNSFACQAVTVVASCDRYRFDRNECWRCLANFNLANGNCVPDSSYSQNCLVYSSANVCTTCDFKYVLSAGQCSLMSVTNCLKNIVNLDTCQICSAGRYLASNRCVPSGSDPGCAVFASDDGSQCTSCLKFFHLTGTSCVSTTVHNCQVYLFNTNYCLYCRSGFVKYNLQCFLDEPHCITFNSVNNACVLCENGYYLVSGRCPASTNTYCKLWDVNVDVCVECQAGFAKERNGVCVVFVFNCHTYHSDKLSCTLCESGFTLFENYVCTRWVNNCFSYQRDGSVCVECQNGYRLWNNLCIIQIANCTDYNSEGTGCVYCAEGFFLKDSKCSPVSVQNCATYVFNTNVCTGCVVNYDLRVDRCVWNNPCLKFTTDQSTCLSCNSTFALMNGRCVIPVNNCDVYSLDGLSCTSCKGGFVLSNSNACEFKGSCVDSASSEVCNECVDGYFLQNGKCVIQSVFNCQAYVPNTNICLSCFEPMIVKDEKCIRYVDNCFVYSSDGSFCENCNYGFYLSGNSCEPNNQLNCFIFAEKSNACEVCTEGFNLVGGTCRASE